MREYPSTQHHFSNLKMRKLKFSMNTGEMMEKLPNGELKSKLVDQLYNKSCNDRGIILAGVTAPAFR